MMTIQVFVEMEFLFTIVLGEHALFTEVITFAQCTIS